MMQERNATQQNESTNWTAAQARYQQWLALPKKERKPKTIELLAQELGLDRVSMWRWRKLDGFMDEVKLLIRGQLGDDLPEIYGALRTQAKKGSFPHIKLALELAGEYVEKQKLDVAHSGGITITSDDIAAARSKARESETKLLNGPGPKT